MAGTTISFCCKTKHVPCCIVLQSGRLCLGRAEMQQGRVSQVSLQQQGPQMPEGLPQGEGQSC
jgi:hypothetical protein